jgi:hypothetical protein
MHPVSSTATIALGVPKDELVQSCLRYIVLVASRYVCYVQHEEYLDLVSIGNLAVVE